MEWSIQRVAELAGTTSRTLRHYDHVGLVSPARIGRGGYRYYNQESLVRLQRVLLLRELGLSLEQIRQVVDAEVDQVQALTTHLDQLHHEQGRLARQVTAVRHTIESLKGREPLMAEDMFDGFDHAQYREEVEHRWGKDAYAKSHQWWTSLSPTERAGVAQRVADLNAAWIVAAEDPDTSPTDAAAQDLAARHVRWLQSMPGTPAAQGDDAWVAYVRSLADLYVADERFAANYGGSSGAEFVRDALVGFLESR